MKQAIEIPRGGNGRRTMNRAHRIRFETGSRLAARSTEDYAEAFVDFLRGGGVQAGLQVSNDAKGGYLAPVVMVARLLSVLDDQCFMRQICTVLPPLEVGQGTGVPVLDTKPSAATWTAEVPAADLADDTAMMLGSRELTPHLCAKLVKVSKRLALAVPDLDTVITERLAAIIGETQESAFLTGSGAQRPLGVFTASDEGISSSRDITSNSQTTFNADDLLRTYFSVKARYANRGSWLMSREALQIARGLVDGNGLPLWRAGLSDGPGLLLDRPVYISEYAPATFTAGQYALAFGDFSKYLILDTLDLEIQRLDELLALKNQTAYIARMHTDGAPAVGEAFARLKLAS